MCVADLATSGPSLSTARDGQNHLKNSVSWGFRGGWVGVSVTYRHRLDEFAMVCDMMFHVIDFTNSQRPVGKKHSSATR